MIGLAIGAAVGVASSLYNSFAERDKAERQLKQLWAAARMEYASTENSVNIMKGAARRSANDAIAEVARVGAANTRETKSNIQKARSTSVAQSEGLTSGITKGKQAVALEVQANKVLHQVKSETTSQINQIVDAKDKAQNDLNIQLYEAHNQLKAALATNLPRFDGLGAALGATMGGLQGASAGASLESSIVGGSSGGGSSGGDSSGKNKNSSSKSKGNSAWGASGFDFNALFKVR